MAKIIDGAFTLEIIWNNDIADISVADGEYMGKISFSCDGDDMRRFAGELDRLYKTLKEGETGLSEPYEPDDNCLRFVSDGLGHFTVSGVFNKWCDCTLEFKKTVDQTYLKSFVKEIKEWI